ncbi:response regulator receiver domain-containing protein [Flavobacterium sp. 270]|uniref:response regulator n=1 Tax=Flavobacterium sp. 270 TaxID=2512114 RepID=UPI001066BDB1|nr:response regulator [Flavobacterium sp. 270]TDW46661.1 response regulator receiver domain-containing protein [Flavobacterium sp. 270]
MYRTILLIDDDPDDLEFLQQAIASLRPDILLQTAGNRSQVLELLENLQIIPDLIFLDFHMPGVIGTELLQKIKTSGATQHIALVLYSTHPKEVMWQIAGAFEPEYCLQKPSSYNELINALKEIIC